MSAVIALAAHSGLARARRGDQAAFAELVELHHVRVWRFIRKWVENPHDVDELTQETFLAAWQRLPGFRAEAQFSTWLLGIALNLTRNHRNRGKARRLEAPLPDDDMLDTVLTAHPDPLMLVQQTATLAALELAIARLPEEMSEVIRLVKLEGLPLDAAARLLDIPIGTAKSRLSRARDRLLVDLKGYLA